MNSFFVIGLGLLLGLLGGFLLIRKYSSMRAQALLADAWAREEKRVRREIARLSRAEVKEAVEEELVEAVHKFPFNASEARFIGHPVEYVIFDGYTACKDGQSSELSSVVFVDVVTDRRALLLDAQLVRECISGGRVHWLTYQI